MVFMGLFRDLALNKYLVDGGFLSPKRHMKVEEKCCCLRYSEYIWIVKSKVALKIIDLVHY